MVLRYGLNLWSGLVKNGYIESLDKILHYPLVLSPQPCVYRASALQALEESGIRWRIVFMSPSYAGIIAAVNAGMGITTLPTTMIPDTLEVIHEDFLPSLPDIHVSLLKQTDKNECLQSLEDFLLKKLTTSI